MEAAVEVEDDVFFAHLSKQISLLIMDEEEDLVTHSPSVSLQAFSRAIQLQPAPQSPFVQEQIGRRESKGTGVFIPCFSHQRRKNRQGRYNHSSSAKYQRHFDHNSRGLPHVPPNNTASYDSFSLRRYQ